MKIIDGKAYADEILNDLKEQVIHLKEHGIIPKLVIIKVGDNPSSEIYIKNKIKQCTAVGIETELKTFTADIGEDTLIKAIKTLNEDLKVHGILVQSPLPKQLNEKKIMSLIDPLKDVDGFNINNVGALATNNEQIIAATPQGIIKLLEKEKVKLAGSHVVIIGRSNIVGRPLALALLNRDATVTICHSKTRNLKEITLTADILIVAIGKAKFITKDYVKDGAIVIDVGINRVLGKVIGDVDFDDVARKASLITPVPGGVGPMTIASLLANLVKISKREK